jgi:hypothetical protein
MHPNRNLQDPLPVVSADSDVRDPPLEPVVIPRRMVYPMPMTSIGSEKVKQFCDELKDEVKWRRLVQYEEVIGHRIPRV